MFYPVIRSLIMSNHDFFYAYQRLQGCDSKLSKVVDRFVFLRTSSLRLQAFSRLGFWDIICSATIELAQARMPPRQRIRIRFPNPLKWLKNQCANHFIRHCFPIFMEDVKETKVYQELKLWEKP